MDFSPESTFLKFTKTTVRHFQICFTNKFSWVISKEAIIIVNYVTPHYYFILKIMSSADCFVHNYQVKHESKSNKDCFVFIH